MRDLNLGITKASITCHCLSSFTVRNSFLSTTRFIVLHKTTRPYLPGVAINALTLIPTHPNIRDKRPQLIELIKAQFK